MTDNEIIKALEYCDNQGITSECEKCSIKNGCRSVLIKNALDLINRQKEEIEELSKFVSEERCYEIAREMIPQFVKQARTAAIKEFAEKLKAETKGLLGANFVDDLVKEMVGESECLK